MNLRTHKRRACAGMTRRQTANRFTDWHRDWFWYPRLQWILQPRGFMGSGAMQWICADWASPRDKAAP